MSSRRPSPKALVAAFARRDRLLVDVLVLSATLAVINLQALISSAFSRAMLIGVTHATDTSAGRATTMSFNRTVGALGGYTALAIVSAGFSAISSLLMLRPRQRGELEPSIEAAR